MWGQVTPAALFIIAHFLATGFTPMSRIFISYDRDDRPFTRELARKLRRIYDHVWFDENLTGGVDWWNEIRSEIAECDIFMYLLTEQSLRSPYCQAEYSEATKLNKHILPVRIAPVRDIPEPIAKVQYVDMSDGSINVENLTELNAAIKKINDAIIREHYTARIPAVKRRRRANALTFVLMIPLLLLAVGVGLVAAAPAPPFDGEILFTNGRGATHDIYMVEGGFSGRVAQLLGNNPRPLANDVTSESPLSISPDGTRVAYTSARGSSTDIYIMNADGSGERQLTNNPANDMQPVWSPNGTQIAFASDRGGDWDIFTIDTSCAPTPDLDCPVTAITNNDFDDQYPTWSLDGVIAFMSNRDNNWDIFTIDASGANELNLTNCPATDEQAPSWSPDGIKLAFMSNRAKLGLGDVPGGCKQKDPNTANWDIYVLDFDRSGIIPITSNPAPDQFPQWSPTDERLVFVSTDRDGRKNLYIDEFRDPGDDVEILDNIDGVGFSAWRP